MTVLKRTIDAAQNFYVDSTSVNGSTTADISAINLYFKHKPDINGALSGVLNPSVAVFITETVFDVPKITLQSGIYTGRYVEVSNHLIKTSSDATVPTTFRFNTPVKVQTNKNYSVCIVFNGSKQFTLWKSTQGEVLTGTTLVSPGSSSKFTGKFFGFHNVFVLENEGNLDDYAQSWQPLTDTSLKFEVFTARYAHNGVPVTANGSIDENDIYNADQTGGVTSNSESTSFNVNFGSYEFISFNQNKSTKADYVGGQAVFQNTAYYPGGYANGSSSIDVTTVAGNNIVVANSQYPNGTTFQWSSIFDVGKPDTNWFVLTNQISFNVRRVIGINSNTHLVLSEAPTFSNSAAKFMITPVGSISGFDRSSPFGVSEAFLVLRHSTANSSVRFVNNSIESIAVTAGGSGYNNSDILYVTGFEDVTYKVTGGYMAVGNVVTNATGGIETIYLSNLGAGFSNSSTITAVIANSTSGNTTANTSAGSSATFSYVVGSTLKTEGGNNTFKECQIRDLDIGQFVPNFYINQPDNTDYTLKLESNYYVVHDNTTISNSAVYVNPNASNNQLQLSLYTYNFTEGMSSTPVIPSKSNEFNYYYANGTPNDKISNTGSLTSQSLKLYANLTTNNDYAVVKFGNPFIQFSKYIINNDSTNEHTDSGNAYAKHLTKIINFGRAAEDIRVYLTAYRPANSEIKVYARIHNNEDTEAFDDKNWTLLEQKEGANVVSSSTDKLNYVEYGYGFSSVPKDRTVTTGSAWLVNNDPVIYGSGTLFDTELSAGDLVYIYQPLFPNNHIVASVISIANSSQMTLDVATTNTSMLADGVKIEKITYPMQAFNNNQNSNIVRYYNSQQSKFDYYDSVAIKIVFLSSSPHIIPRVDDLRVTGVSA